MTGVFIVVCCTFYVVVVVVSSSSSCCCCCCCCCCCWLLLLSSRKPGSEGSLRLDFTQTNEVSYLGCSPRNTSDYSGMRQSMCPMMSSESVLLLTGATLERGWTHEMLTKASPLKTNAAPVGKSSPGGSKCCTHHSKFTFNASNTLYSELFDFRPLLFPSAAIIPIRL